MRNPAAAAVVVSGALAFGGCAAPPAAPAAPAAAEAGVPQAPLDLTIDLTVLRGRDVIPRARAHLRPARWVLFPDGSLHYNLLSQALTTQALMPQTAGGDPGLLLRELPPRVRTLSRERMAAVWLLLDEIGWASADRGVAPVSPSAIEVRRDETTWVAIITGNGRRWSFVHRTTVEPPEDDPAARLVRAMAALVWATDVPDAPVAVAPRRYDFGPDPYARYRQP